LEKFSAVALGNLICAVKQTFGEEGENFDQSDTGVAFVEVGPLGGVDGDPRERIVEELLVTAIVNLGKSDGHGGKNLGA
jgi:hypothetical protein